MNQAKDFWLKAAVAWVEFWVKEESECFVREIHDKAEGEDAQAAAVFTYISIKDLEIHQVINSAQL